LPYPHLQVAAIKLLRDQTVFGRILLDIRIQQIEFDPADLQLPDLRRYVPAKNVDMYVKRLIPYFGFPQRQMIEILVQAHSFLPTILVDLLLEVTASVKQRYRAEIEVKVTRRLAVVAGKNSQAAGIVRHGLVKPELR
jgi:hypothetical protein